MKRILFSITGTVAGVVALLSFKSHGHPIAAAGPLPSAGLPDSGSSSPSPGSSAPVPRRSSSASSGSTASRTVIGDAIQTPYGIVQIKVTVAGNRIAQASYVQLTAYDGHSQEINSEAAPILLQETLSAQNANINTVSGATFTSQGYIQSLQSALDKAGIK